MSDHNITTFLSKFGAGARPNRFKVRITGGGSNLTNLEFVCRAATIPGAMITRTDLAYMGRIVKISGDRDVEDWSISVYNDLDWRIRKAFEEWSDKIMKYEENVTTYRQEEYMASATVYQLGRDASTIATYELKDIFPLVVTPIQLGWDANNQVETFDVTFAVNWVNMPRT